MSLFKKKPQTSAAKRKNVELMFDDLGKKALGFGLQWRSIATSDVRKAGIAIARVQSATHILFRGQQVGFGSIDVKAHPHLSSGASIYPAAQVAGRQYGGDALFVVNVAPEEYWIALIRNGSPTSTDAFLMKTNDTDVVVEAKRILESVSGERAVITIYTNLHGHDFTGVVKTTSADEIFLAAVNDEDCLGLIPKVQMTLPMPVLVVLGLGSLFLVGQQAMKWWDAKNRVAMLAQNRVAQEDPEVTWARVIAEWEAGKARPNSMGLAVVRDSIGQLPLLWDGWLLTSANCTASKIIPPAKVRAWTCSAMYERRPGAILNREMVSNVPKNWSVAFLPLKGMRVGWSLEQTIEPLQRAEFKSTNFHMIETVSQFQAIALAFSQDIKLDFGPVSIEAPKAPDGTNLPPSADASALREANLSMQGPLRTINVLIDRNIPADWTSLGVTFSSTNSVLSINSSAVTAEVKGVIYAKN